MDDLYRDYILEHYRRPHNFGVIDDPTASFEGSNPLCGDRITLQLGIRDGVVERVGFTGRGCAISQASAQPPDRRDQGQAASPTSRPSAPTTCSTSSASTSARPGSSARCSATRRSRRRWPRPAPPTRRPPRRPRRTHDDAPRALLHVSPAGLAGTEPTRPSSSALPATHRQPVVQSEPPEPHATNLRRPPQGGPRDQIREVTPAEVEALQPGGAAIVDVREDSEWEQGHLPGADPHQQELRRAADRERRPGSRRAGHPLLRRRRPLPLRGPDARAARLHERRLDVGRVPGLEVAGPAVGGAGHPQPASRSSATAATC